MKDKEKQIFDKYGNYDFPTELKQDGLNVATSQIGEISNIIKAVKYEPFNNGKPTYTVGNQMQDFVFDLIAEELLKHYQLVDKNSVVLSREEYESLKSRADDKCKYDCWLIDMPDFEREKDIKTQASKETAEKFAKEMLSWLEKDDIDGRNCVIEVAKQFGVEIKE